MTSELRVTLNFRISGDLNASVTFVHIADADFEEAGRNDRDILDAYLAGYGEKDRGQA